MGATSSRQRPANENNSNGQQSGRIPAPPYTYRIESQGIGAYWQQATAQNGARYGSQDPAGYYHPGQQQHAPPPPQQPPLRYPQYGQGSQQAYAPSPYAPPPPTQEFTQTSTIRNQVNLKKHTLEVVPLDGAGQPLAAGGNAASAKRLAIRFKFDASAACQVTTFVMGAEDAAGGCAISLPRGAAPPPAVPYSKGLGQQFPPPADAAVPQAAAAAGAHVVDLASVPDAANALSRASGPTYPLIVRLETLSDAGRKEGKSLAALPPGAPLPSWVQCQTTYATLHLDDGAWVARVVKQKIWVNAVSYELQEIYGMEQNRVNGSAAGATGGGDELDGRECVICLSSERDTTVLPCRHMCMCNECARALKTQTNRCPICRNEIESLLHIKIQKGLRPPAAAAPAPSAAPAAAAGGAQNEAAALSTLRL